MHRILALIAVMTVCGVAASAQTADEIVADYLKAVGGTDKIQAVHSLRRSGKYVGGGGFEAVILQENKRDASVRPSTPTMARLAGRSSHGMERRTPKHSVKKR